MIRNEMPVHLLHRIARNQDWRRFIVSSEFEVPLQEKRVKQDARKASIEDIAKDPPSAFVTAMVLRETLPYMFHVAMEGLTDTYAYHFEYGNLGDFGVLNRDTLARIFCFCGESSIAKSIAPTCLGLRYFVASKEFLSEICGYQFADTLKTIFDKNDGARFARAVSEADSQVLQSMLSRYARVSKRLPQPLKQIGFLESKVLELRVEALAMFLSNRKELHLMVKRLDKISIAAIEIVKSDSLVRILAQCLELGRCLNNNKEIKAFCFSSLSLLAELTSRFDQDFTALHQVLDSLNYSSSQNSELLIQLFHDSRFLEAVCETPWGTGCFGTIFESKCKLDEINTLVKRIESSHDNFYVSFKSVVSIFRARALELKTAIQICETNQQKAIQYLIGSEARQSRLSPVQEQELNSLLRFLVNCSYALHQETDPSLAALKDRVNRALALESIAINDNQENLKSRGVREPQNHPSVEEGLRKRVQAKVEAKLIQAKSAGATISKERQYKVRADLAKVNLDLKSRACRIEGFLGRSFSERLERIAAATCTDNVREKFKGREFESSAKSLSDNSDSTTEAPPKERKKKTKTWNLEIISCTSAPIWRNVEERKCGAQNFSKIEKIFSLGPIVSRTKVIQQEIKSKHFTYQDFAGARTRDVTKVLPFPVTTQSTLKQNLVLSYDQLVGHIKNDTWSKYGLERAAIEQHLDDDEFYSTFKLNRTEFYQLPAWRQRAIKSKKGLF